MTPTSPAPRPPEILLVEDSPSDVRLTQEAFKERQVLHHLHVVRDGEAALAFLRRESHYQNVPRPDLVLLDLNLPRKDGRQVLAEMKADEQLKMIPVCMLSTSAAQNDIRDSYRLGANCYAAKELDINEFIAQMRAIYDFWFGTVRLPGE